MMKRYINCGEQLTESGVLYTAKKAKCLWCGMVVQCEGMRPFAMQIGNWMSAVDDGEQEYGHKLRGWEMMSKVGTRLRY